MILQNSTATTVSRNKSLTTATKSNPCPHCGKPDWCYSIGDLSVCNRDQPPAEGWEETSKADSEGHKFYAPKQEKKPIRHAQARHFKYPDRDGQPLVIVERIDDGYGKKKIWQQHWDKDKKQWVKGLGDIKHEDIPPYRYAEVKKAIANGDRIFIVDGESCVDTLWDLGLAATTSIGGMGKWRESDTQFLNGAMVVITPDRDKPGIEDAGKLSKHFPDAQWLFAYPDSKVWYNLSKSGGLDIKDWIEGHNLKAEDIRNAIMTDKKEIEAFRAILMKAGAVDNKSHDTGDRKTKKPPTPRETAALIAEQYGHQWKYDNEQKEWRVYSGKHWEKVEIGNFETLLMTVVDAKNIAYSSDAYLNDVLALLTKLLREKHWGGADRRRFINFSNCVLDGSSGKTREHQPGDRFTSYLPFEHKPLAGDTNDALQALEANCPNISTWMRTAMRGDAKKILKLLAIINGCLRFSFHGWQQFVHLIGAPGSGKGTFARLMEKVVGKDNTQPCSLESLKDGSTLASIIDKQLVVFGDERKPVGVESILRLTGGDSVNYREVYRPAANAYFYGLLLICSNDPIFMGNTTGLERRLCLVEFNNPIPKALRNSEVEASFDDEIASLIAIALSLSGAEVAQAIKGIGDAEIADFKAAEWDMKVRMDSLAAFFEMELVVEDGASIRAGDLFDSYKDFCEEIKKPAQSLTSFSPGLEKLCTELHLPVVRDRSGRHVTFVGLRLRGKNDEHPTYSQQLAALCRTSDNTCRTSAPLGAGLPPIRDKALQDLQDLSPNILGKSEISQQVGEVGEKYQNETEIKNVSPLSPASPASPIQDRGSSPAPSGAEVVQSPVNPPQSSATAQNRFFANKLADDMREAIAEGSREKAKEVMDRVASSAPQVRSFFSKSFSKEENLNIRFLKYCGLTKGTSVNYVGEKFAEQYDGEILIVDNLNAQNEIACLRPSGKGFTAWLKSEDLRKL